MFTLPNRAIIVNTAIVSLHQHNGCRNGRSDRLTQTLSLGTECPSGLTRLGKQGLRQG